MPFLPPNQRRQSTEGIGNESAPKIMTNDKINLFFFQTVIGILVISSGSRFRVLFDKTASVYFIGKIYLYLALEMAGPENR